jgi:hypothetical protein
MFMNRAAGKDLAEVNRGLSDGTLSRYSSDETKGNYIRDMIFSGFTPFEDSYCDHMGDDIRQSGMYHTVL